MIHQNWTKDKIRDYMKQLNLGKGEWILFHGMIPDDIKQYIKRKAKRDGFRATFNDEVKVSISTKQTQAAAREEQKARSEFYDDWINSPG